jgi:hypothetical protein
MALPPLSCRWTPLAVLLLAALAVTIVSSGCSASSDIEGTPLAGSGDQPSSAGDDASVGNASSSGGGACVATPPTPIDPSTLPSCCTAGAAHCVPTASVPPADIPALAACTGGYCVPDPFISNPDYVPPACTAYNGTPGTCLSVCVPQVSEYKSILTQATCAATELCAPCINPLTNQPSGACAFQPPTQCADGGGRGSSSGGGGAGDAAPPPAACPHTGPPVLDPSTLPACGTEGGAHCLQSALVPANLASQLATCSGGYCVPDTFIEAGGNFIPPTCASLDGAEGRCLNVVIPQVAAQASQLTQSTCQSYEKCVPCFSPINGEKTGACDLSCDPGPTKPIVLFPTCCSEDGTDEGRCVPETIVPSSEQSNLSADSCATLDGTKNLCVPSEMLDLTSFKPPACTATGFLVGSYTGVCLSNCLSFGIEGIALAQGSCDSIHTCAPCKNPLTGAATGAPGCP